jgi:hypothetical protein
LDCHTRVPSGVLERTAERGNQLIPRSNLSDEGFKIATFPVAAFIADCHSKPNPFGGIEHCNDGQMASQKVFESMLVGVLGLAERVPSPTIAVLNRQTMILA